MDKIQEKLISYCVDIDRAREKKNVRMHNVAMDKNRKLHKVLHEDIEHAKLVLIPLLKDERNQVRLSAAAHCLALGIAIEKAKETLQQLAVTCSVPQIALNAQFTLEVFEQQGYLKM